MRSMGESCNGPDRSLSRDDLRINECRHSRDIRIGHTRESKETFDHSKIDWLFKAWVPPQIWFRAKGEKKSEGKAHDFLAGEMKVPRAHAQCCALCESSIRKYAIWFITIETALISFHQRDTYVHCDSWLLRWESLSESVTRLPWRFRET